MMILCYRKKEISLNYGIWSYLLGTVVDKIHPKASK